MRGHYYYYGYPGTSPIPYGNFPGYSTGYPTAAGWIFMALWAIFFIVVIAGLIRWIFFPRRRRYDGASNHALDILNERYARGEITKAQLDSMRRDIEA